MCVEINTETEEVPSLALHPIEEYFVSGTAHYDGGPSLHRVVEVTATEARAEIDTTRPPMRAVPSLSVTPGSFVFANESVMISWVPGAIQPWPETADDAQLRLHCGQGFALGWLHAVANLLEPGVMISSKGLEMWRQAACILHFNRILEPRERDDVLVRLAEALVDSPDPTASFRIVLDEARDGLLRKVASLHSHHVYASRRSRATRSHPSEEDEGWS